MPNEFGELAWPERGNFGFRPLVGPYRYDPRRMMEDRGYFGLVPEGALHYGNLRDEDGHLYSFTRRFTLNDASLGHQTLIVQSTRNDDGCLRFDRSLMGAAGSGAGAEKGTSGDGAFRRSPKGAAGGAYEITYRPDGMSWEEEGVLSLDGTFRGPGLQWYLPQPDKGLLYVSAMFETRGTIGGRRARGFLCCDQVFMTPGAVLYAKDDPLAGEHTHVTWYTWGTCYKDGSFEGGHFSAGHDKWGFALTTTDRQIVTASTNVDAIIRPGPNSNFPEGITLRVDNELWEFLPDPRGAMPDFLGKSQPSTPQNEGRWQRAGETREPDIYWAWGEINPASGLTKKFRYRF